MLDIDTEGQIQMKVKSKEKVLLTTTEPSAAKKSQNSNTTQIVELVGK